ncbi:MAG: hypothetical protein K6U74_07015 [Firmicutes bacterium]|nr:hypothetical protein [Bacillota bacterium]
MPRRAYEPAGITFRAEYEPDMERMVQALRIVLEAPRRIFESVSRSTDSGTSIVDEDRPDVEGVRTGRQEVCG